MTRARFDPTAFLAAVLISGAAATSSAQQTPNPCAAIQPNPADVTVQLAFKNGQTTVIASVLK